MSRLRSQIATGIVKINGQLIIILDFERIVSDISPRQVLRLLIFSSLKADQEVKHILLAEDSPLIKLDI